MDEFTIEQSKKGSPIVTGSRNYYEVLGVSPSVEDFVLKAVFRALVKKYHPDVYNNSDGAERIREINVAYEVLSDPAKRSAYDNARGGDQEWRDPSGRHQADLPAEVWVTPDTCLVVPAHVMHDRAVISLVRVSRLCAKNFLANWGSFSSASAAGFEGMQLLTSVAQTAITEIFVNAASLGLPLTPEQLWGLIIEPMLPDAERPLSDLRYAAIGVSEADQRRLTRQTGEFIAAELDRTITAGVNALLDAAAREGIDIELPNIIAQRNQSAQSMITATIPQSLARAAASIQTSMYENDAALSIALKHLLSNSGWEDRLAQFVSLVENAGPDHFFDSKTQTGARPGSLCLTEKIDSLFKMNEKPNIIRSGLQAIEGVLPQWWQEAGQHLVATNVGQSFTENCAKIVDAAEIGSVTARLATASGMRERAVVLASSIEDREQCFRRILSHWISLPTTTSLPPEYAKEGLNKRGVRRLLASSVDVRGQIVMAATLIVPQTRH